MLDRYYTTFPIYNPYLEQLPVKGRRDNYKYYDVDGMTGGGNYGNYGHLNNGNGYYGNSYGLHPNNDSRVSSPAFRGKKEFGHNDLFYEEYEYERRSVRYISTDGMLYRRKIKPIESNAKCPVKGLCGRCFYMSEAPSPPMTPYPPTPYTLYTCIQ